MGAGNDRLTMLSQNSGADGYYVNGSLVINTDVGNDPVQMRAQNSGSGARFDMNSADLTIETGGDNDVVSRLTRGSGNFDVGTGTVTFDGGDGTKDRLTNPAFPSALVLNFETVRP